jgi:hypothetical protein
MGSEEIVVRSVRAQRDERARVSSNERARIYSQCARTHGRKHESRLYSRAGEAAAWHRRRADPPPCYPSPPRRLPSSRREAEGPMQRPSPSQAAKNGASRMHTAPPLHPTQMLPP